MSPEHARMYAYVHPLFWGWLWLQLQLFTSWQKQSGRTLLIAVTRWGNIYTVQIGDKVTTYRKPEALKASWDDPVWQTSNPPNLVGAFSEFSENPPTEVFEGDAFEAHPERSRRISGLTPDTS